MTIAEFVEKHFVPEHVAAKKPSGRTHYRAILKHVLTPEEVDGIFQAGRESSRARLKSVPDWPYLSNAPLHAGCSDEVQRLLTAGLARGYSTQTVIHIRNVVRAIFEHARKKFGLAGDNPADSVTLPEMVRKETHALTLAQAKHVLGVMRYPEKEMAMIAILTRMNMAEICGLQWKCVNLTDDWAKADSELIPPRTIAVRNQWRFGQLSAITKSGRRRTIPIPEPLLPALLSLSRRVRYTGPEDFVLVSRTGTPVNDSAIAARRLKRVGKELGMPWLSWQVFRRTRTKLAYELGMQSLERAAGRAQPEYGSSPAPPYSYISGSSLGLPGYRPASR
jgi:integrase